MVCLPIYLPKNNVGKCTSPMDPMGIKTRFQGLPTKERIVENPRFTHTYCTRIRAPDPVVSGVTWGPYKWPKINGSLSQWPNFKLFGITYISRENKPFKLFFSGSRTAE